MRRFGALLLIAVFLAACSDDDDRAAEAAVTATTTTTTTEPLPERYVEQRFSDLDVTRDVEYGSAPGVDGAPETLLLDIFQPGGDDEDDRAAILFVHGGGFGFGDKSDGVSPNLAEDFAKRGYVTASVNYRLLAPGGCSGTEPGASGCTAAAIEGIHDVQAAVRWLRASAETYGVDPDRIGIAGESAGGVIAYGVGAWSDVPGESGTPGVSSRVQAWMAISGGAPGAIFATPDDAPGILFASTGDPIVPHQWSADIEAKLTELGVPVELVTYDLDVHVPFLEHRDDIVEKTVAFFAEHLVGAASRKGS